MTRPPGRVAALQAGEFAVGVVAAYVAVGAVWTASGEVWALVLVALALIGLAVAAELRFGPKATGLLAGLVPTAVLAAGLFTALSGVLARLR
jgi:hypothetical protein